MTILAGRYELGEEFGSGGVGRVVVAHDQLLGRDVAVKLLSPAADATTRQRFVREARAAARLHHPNAVAVYDTGEADGQPFLVMELVRGRSLADVLAQDGPLEVEEAVAITAGVLEGLEAAHRAGMVHRDVKPGNVLLPDEGGVKLSDFGIAKALHDETTEVTVAGVLMGTPAYLAPELLAGDPPSPASDVYGVGCLLYAELTGAPPFTRGDAMAIAYAHRHEPVPPITSRRADVPGDLAEVIAVALAKDPAERYGSAAAMRTGLLDGPAAVPAAEDVATVAVPMAGDRERTQVLAGSDEPTRAVGSGAPAAAAGASAGGADRAADRRLWPVAVAVLALLLLAGAIWLLLDRDGGDAPAGDAPADDAPVDEAPADEVEEEPEEPADEETPGEGPADPDETPPDDPGPPDESEDNTLDDLSDDVFGDPDGS